MEVFNRLPWCIQKNILSYHKPYIFDEIYKSYIYNILLSSDQLSNDDYMYYFDDNKIILSDIRLIPILIDIFDSNLGKYILILDNDKYYFNFSKYSIKIVIDFTWKIMSMLLNLINTFSFFKRMKISFCSSFVSVEGIETTQHAVYIFYEFCDYIIDYFIYDWKENGQEIHIILYADKDLILYIDNASNAIFPIINI